MANSNNAGSNQVPEWIPAFNKFVEIFIMEKKSVFLEHEVDFNKTWSEDIKKCLKLLEDVGTMNPPQNKDDKKVDNSLYAKLKNLDKTSDDYKRQYALLWHCYYIMYIMGDTAKTFFPEFRPEDLDYNEIIQDEHNSIKLFVVEYASTRQIYNSEPIRPFRCLLKLFQKIWNNTEVNTDNIGSIMLKEKNGKKTYWQENGDEKDYDDRIKNILIYLCKPNDYVRIISQTHKDNIYENLSFLLPRSNNQLEEKEKDYKTMDLKLQIQDVLKAFNSFDEDIQKEDNLGKKEKLENFYNDTLENDPKTIQELIDELKSKIKEAKQQNGTGSGVPSQHNHNTFYSNRFRPFWDDYKDYVDANAKYELETETLLRYKKAIVLYGPPGTSKSYTARELSKSIIRKEFAKKLKNEKQKTLFDNFLANEDVLFGKEKKKDAKDTQNKPIMAHIHQLQLHPNYTYDDFIVGKTIRNNCVEIQKGFLLHLIDEINIDRTNNNNDYAQLPHIVILDEINRVDISRVFGELFTAMESGYRKDGVVLSVGNLKLKVPEDLYFIGTMNMIDFSLEQVDFALRRRFAWIENTFDKDRLKDIIKEKDQDPIFDIDKYVQLCNAVNKKIEEKMGKEYWIGHTFFAEIVDIIKITGFDTTQKQEENQIPQNEDKKEISKARKFLWAISIKPMIEAYCGSMDNEAKKGFVKECREAFIPEGKMNNNIKTEE